MNKHDLIERLARNSHRSRGHAADKLDALIYKLWKEARDPRPKCEEEESAAISTAPVKKS